MEVRRELSAALSTVCRLSPVGSETPLFVCLFSGLTAATVLFGFMRNLILFYVLVRCAQSLHNRMFNSILRTPVHFFDINPIGKQKLFLTLDQI